MGGGGAGYLKVNAEPSLPRAESAGPGAKGQNRQPWGQACEWVSWSVIHMLQERPHTWCSSQVDWASPRAGSRVVLNKVATPPPQGNSKSQSNNQTMHLCLCGQYVTCILVTKITSHYKFL